MILRKYARKLKDLPKLEEWRHSFETFLNNEVGVLTGHTIPRRLMWSGLRTHLHAPHRLRPYTLLVCVSHIHHDTKTISLDR